jgi:hypothetical protein
MMYFAAEKIRRYGADRGTGRRILSSIWFRSRGVGKRNAAKETSGSSYSNCQNDTLNRKGELRNTGPTNLSFMEDDEESTSENNNNNGTIIYNMNIQSMGLPAQNQNYSVPCVGDQCNRVSAKKHFIRMLHVWVLFKRHNTSC